MPSSASLRRLPSKNAVAAFLIGSIALFICAIALTFFGLSVSVVSTFPMIHPQGIITGIAAALIGLPLTCLGSTLMSYYSDCLHDRCAARSRDPMTGYLDTLRTFAVMIGVIVFAPSALIAAACLPSAGFDIPLVAFTTITGMIGLLSLLAMRSPSLSAETGMILPSGNAIH